MTQFRFNVIITELLRVSVVAFFLFLFLEKYKQGFVLMHFRIGWVVVIIAVSLFFSLMIKAREAQNL